jgi:hypothetical protein
MKYSRASIADDDMSQKLHFTYVFLLFPCARRTYLMRLSIKTDSQCEIYMPSDQARD